MIPPFFMPMKLIIFSNTYPYRYGESFLEEELAVLVNYFNDITVIPLHYGNREIRTMPAGVKLAEPILDFSPKNRTHLMIDGLFNLSSFDGVGDYYFSSGIFSGRKIWSFHRYLLLRRAMLKSIRKKIRRIGGDGEDVLLYFYWGDKSVMILPELKKAFPEARAVVRFHGADLYEEVPGMIPFRKRIFPCIDLAVTISEEGRKYLYSRYSSFCPKNVVVSHLGVKDYKFNYMFESSSPESPYQPFAAQEITSEESVFRLVSCSDLIPLKRVGLVMDALELISSDELTVFGYDRIEWTHIGEGEMFHPLRSRAASYMQKPEHSHFSFAFKGAMRHQEVMRLYKENRYDLFILLSENEGIPVSIMEALSFEMPVLASSVGGVPEIVGDDCGVLLPASPSPFEVKAAILSFMAKDRKDIESMRKSARTDYETRWDSDKNYSSFAAMLLTVH